VIVTVNSKFLESLRRGWNRIPDFLLKCVWP